MASAPILGIVGINGWSHVGAEPGAHDAAFDLVASKLAHPPVRTGTVRRRAILERLAQGRSTPVVSLVAPAGYGKTTLLAQWAEADDRPFAWVSLDRKDNDAKALLTYTAEALGRIESIPGRVFEALKSLGTSVPGTVVPRLGAAFAGMSTPVVLVFDDVHEIHNVEAKAALAVLADHVPEGSQIVFSSRSEPPLRVARLRAAGRLIDIGPEELSLTKDEAFRLLRGAAVDLEGGELDEVYQRTEGWAAGLYLAALRIRQGGPSSGASQFGDGDRFVGEYIEAEFLRGAPRSERLFLTRASALERMSPALCDAVLGLPGAGATLDALVRANLFVVPLDERRQWYRFHHLFHDVLRTELMRTDPSAASHIRRRAADWYLEQGLPEEAIEAAMLAEDVERVAALLPTLWGPVYRRGRIETLQRWFSWLEERDGIERHPVNAMNAAFLAMTTGRPLAAEHWSQEVERMRTRDGGRPFTVYEEALAAILRAMSFRDGPERMRQDADDARRLFSTLDATPQVATLLQGTSRELSDDLAGADAFLEDVEAIADQASPDIRAVVLAERALIAIARRDWAAADEFSERSVTGLRRDAAEESYAGALCCAVRARVLQHLGDIPNARAELATALRLRPLLTYAISHRAVQCRLAIVRVQLALDDVAGARTVMREIDEIIHRRPLLGTLVAEADALRTSVAAKRRTGVAGASSLTTAELRVLPMLATHLTYAEIAAENFVSENTVKSQAYSLFRKLGVSSRGEAVVGARRLGLLEG